MAAVANPFVRLFRGETHMDFAGRWRRWFALSGIVIIVGLVSLGARGLNFSVDFRGGTIWQVPTTASVTQIGTAIDKVSSNLSQAQIQVQTDRSTNQRVVQVQADAKVGSGNNVVTGVAAAMAGVAHTSTNAVNIQSVGAAWGADITDKAIKAVIVFLIVVTVYIWFRFEGKMALAALVALVHDILVTVGIYSLSGLQVSPDTVIAFLTILGYSLYDTIVVFDKVQENTRSLASSGRQTYSDVVNVSMNQVLARSLNTSFVAIIPILSILVIGSGVLGASTLNDFGLALFIGLTTGAYSSIFVASPLLGLLKEREPRYREIRRRLAEVPAAPLTPRARRASGGPGARAGRGRPVRRRPELGQPSDEATTSSPSNGSTTPAPPAPATPVSGNGGPLDGAPTDGGPSDAGPGDGADSWAQPDDSSDQAAVPPPAVPSKAAAARGPGGAAATSGATPVPPRSGNRPPPRPRKKPRKR